MLSLTRIFLHNWHRFTHHVIDVEDSLYFAGHNGSGKSSVLDAIQLVLIADLQRVRFNSSAQERSQRNLDSYVRGKIGEGRLLRPGDTVAYIALEFSDTVDRRQITLGVCVEAGKDRTPERTFVIVPDALDVSLFMPEGRERSRRQLRDAIRQRRGARSFDHVGEYQDELRNRLGGLNQRFFDLFLRALTFQPIRNIRDFVEQWLLEPSSLDLDTLRRVKERLSDLRIHARQVEAKLAALNDIVKEQEEVRRLRDLFAAYTLLVVLLSEIEAQRRVDRLSASIQALRGQIAQGQRNHAEASAAREGAQKAYIAAQVRLEQSDVIRRRDELAHTIERLKHEADAIRERWRSTRQRLQGEMTALQPFLAAAPFEPQERAALDSCAALIGGLSAAAPPATLAAVLETTISALDQARERSQEQLFAINQQLKDLHERRALLQSDLTRLLDPTSRPIYPPTVERLRDLLTPVIGERPPLLCELLEIPDERWQDAVEAMLAGRRLNVIVPPARFQQALRELDRARAAEQLYDVGLLDLEKARSEAREARAGSLAHKVQVSGNIRPLRAYIDTILGDIITCETVDELRQHRRAVTAEVVVYGEWTARSMSPQRYRPWFIGQQARQSQIEALQTEQREIDGRIAELAPQQRDLLALVRGLDHGRSLSLLRQRLDETLDEQPLRAEIVAAEQELQSLDLSGVATLEREVVRLKQLVDDEQRAVDDLVGYLAGMQADLHAKADRLQTAQQQLTQCRQQTLQERERLSQAVAPAEQLLAERIEQPDLEPAIRSAESTARNFETRAVNTINRLTELGTAYNTAYQFVALPGNHDDPRYAAEQQRLAATELPRFSEQIEQAQREAEEELREHVLHRLREQIFKAREQLDRINDALRSVEFHGERYRFIAEPASEVRAYYDLINDAQILGTAKLFESEFYERHRATFDQFYDALTGTPQSESERLEQERLTDFRRYLSYDIEVRHGDGNTSKLSKIMGQTSGGETQTPFYVTIAASFVQLYRINERSGRPTIRLVAFDEAFSKMDQDRIGATLDLFQSFKLQIITATPLERCEYLVPKMCTSLVLTGIGDRVWIEHYRNYAAKLEAVDAV
ncbi:MAG TPA: SbcC/MukB-like Walker B domain-containing protein [Herpetosiphonaceae bacterium]